MPSPFQLYSIECLRSSIYPFIWTFTHIKPFLFTFIHPPHSSFLLVCFFLLFFLGSLISDYYYYQFTVEYFSKVAHTKHKYVDVVLLIVVAIIYFSHPWKEVAKEKELLFLIPLFAFLSSDLRPISVGFFLLLPNSVHIRQVSILWLKCVGERKTEKKRIHSFRSHALPVITMSMLFCRDSVINMTRPNERRDSRHIINSVILLNWRLIEIRQIYKSHY